MNYRGQILRMSIVGEDNYPRNYVCTAHYAGHVEVVPIVRGAETRLLRPVPLLGVSPGGLIHDFSDDPELIERTKARYAAIIRFLERNGDLFLAIFGRHKLDDIRKNFARLESLDGDQPVINESPAPEKSTEVSCEQPKDEQPDEDAPMPNYVGKLLLLGTPFDFDWETGSGEYIILDQSKDSLYGVKTSCCLSRATVIRIPLSNTEILNCHEDDAFIEEFITRLDGMEDMNYDTRAHDSAIAVARQLRRMLQRKKEHRADARASATDRVFSTVGSLSGRMVGESSEGSTKCAGGRCTTCV